jgi:hypothetical protein
MLTIASQPHNSVFHGRDAFTGFGVRNLVGCYAEMDEVDKSKFD